MTLASVVLGVGPPVAFVHGFTQTGRSWLPVIESLDMEISATLIDAPGHGDSTNGKRTLIEAADDIATSMTRGVLVGYSMGARMALHTALFHPDKVTALVLISGTAGIDSEGERLSRRMSDQSLSERLLSIGVQTFVEEWLRLPMFKNLNQQSANVSDRLLNTAQGLADSLTFAGTGTQEPLWATLSSLDMPVLIVAGEEDQKFVEIAQRMSALIPQSKLFIVSGSGHTVHLEQPEIFTQVLETFLASQQSNK